MMQGTGDPDTDDELYGPQSVKAPEVCNHIFF